MVTLFASLVGFCSSIFPELLKISRDKIDKRHELAMFEMQIEMQKLLNKDRVDYVDTIGDISEIKTLHNSYHSSNASIEALNSSVRPILAYSFFFLYGVVKFLKFFIIKEIMFFEDSLEVLWSQEDQAIFATIISFYFGQRALMKFRNRKVNV